MFKPEGYEKSMIGNYMKFQDGENRIRILEEPITGYVFWSDSTGNLVPRNKMAGQGGKPIRIRTYDELTMPQKAVSKAFAAVIVWNYQVEKIQILEIKQVGIINSLEALGNSKSWGDVTTFDISINRTRTGPNNTDVEYSAMPEPKKKVTDEISSAYFEANININALFDGKDPFKDAIDVDDIVKDLDD